MVLLGGLGPVLLLAVMAVFGLRGYRQATEQSADAIRKRAFESNKFAAAFLARSLEGEFRRYFEVVAEEAAMPAFLTAFRTVTAMPEAAPAGGAGARARRVRGQRPDRAVPGRAVAPGAGRPLPRAPGWVPGGGARRSPDAPLRQHVRPGRRGHAPGSGVRRPRRAHQVGRPLLRLAVRTFTAARRTCPATRRGRASRPPSRRTCRRRFAAPPPTPGGWG